MVGGEKDYLYRANQEQRDFHEYKIKVRQGLGLGVTIVPEIPFDLRDKIVTETATNMVNLCGELDIPLPFIGIKSADEEARLIATSKTPGSYLLANSEITNEHPEGIIEFSSKYLTQVVRFRMGEGTTIPKPLELIVAHEAFHLWQHRGDITREIIRSDNKKFEAEGLLGWNSTQTEIDANEFANRWLEKLYNRYRIS